MNEMTDGPDTARYTKVRMMSSTWRAAQRMARAWSVERARDVEPSHVIDEILRECFELPPPPLPRPAGRPRKPESKRKSRGKRAPDRAPHYLDNPPEGV